MKIVIAPGALKHYLTASEATEALGCGVAWNGLNLNND